MRTLKMYSMFDKEGQRYDTPFFCFDDLGAKRHFIMTSRKVDTIVANFKDDFELYHIGDFVLEEGAFKSLEKPRRIMTGLQIKKED